MNSDLDLTKEGQGSVVMNRTTQYQHRPHPVGTHVLKGKYELYILGHVVQYLI